MTPKICPNCYYVGKPKKIAKGEFILELCLWLVGVGIIYSLWRHLGKYEVCPKCKAQNLLSLDSTRGKELWAHVLPDEQTRKEKLSIMKRQYKMEGLANASLVLGIIGFLSSFVLVLGLGILPSILAVMLGIYPLIKKIQREKAITGIILGSLGILLSIGFIHLKPEDITKQTTKEITQEELSTPTPEKSLPQQGHIFQLSNLSNKSIKQAPTQSSTTRSGIYKWVDKDGVTHVTNDINSIPPEYRDKLINER